MNPCHVAALAGRLVLLLLLPVAAMPAAENAKVYQPQTHGAGRLEYVGDLPVLSVQGTPEQIGEQLAVLAARPARPLLEYPRDYLKRMGAAALWPGLLKVGQEMLENFPEHHLQEMRAIARHGQLDFDLLVAGNTLFDIKKFFLCSALLVEPQRSSTGGMLMGRNLDFPSLGYLDRYTLVTVYRPEGKRSFVSVGFPGLIGCVSGMNDAGLCVAVLEVYATGDDSRRFDAGGTPYALCYRRLLEECATVEEALALLRSMKRTTLNNLAICDRRRGGVFEITPQRVEFREAERGIAPCTNHFRTDPLRVAGRCPRYARLAAAMNGDRKLSVADVAARLHEVNQGVLTLHTMVFEPQRLRLHLSVGNAPSSAHPLHVLELESRLTGAPAADIGAAR